MRALTYTVDGGLCVTPCPWGLQMYDRPIMVGSWACHGCGHCHALNADKNTVQCRADETRIQKH